MRGLVKKVKSFEVCQLGPLCTSVVNKFRVLTEGGLLNDLPAMAWPWKQVTDDIVPVFRDRVLTAVP